MITKVTKSESEKVVGEDEHRIPIVECPAEKPVKVQTGTKMIGKQWYRCPECEAECLHEVNGQTYYHRISCSKSNGIIYKSDRPESSPKNI